MRLNIKPLSVNKCWQGRRFKTKDYKAYEEELLLTLPKIEIPDGKMTVIYKVGYSNPLADIDNFIKPFQDILQKKYNFNDRNIYTMIVEKDVVKKGEEYIELEITEYNSILWEKIKKLIKSWMITGQKQ